jgi:hypothetical protein
MQILFRKHELARALNRDARFIARVGLVPTAQAFDGFAVALNGPAGDILFRISGSR